MAYPVAPDTSYNAYMNSTASAGERSWWNKTFGPMFRNGQKYDQWKLQKENQYNSDVADFTNLYNSYANQKDMLESAGYNPNYQGMSSTAGSAGGPGSYTTPEGAGQINSNNALQSIIGLINTSIQLATGVSGIGSTIAGIKNTSADTSLKQYDLTQMKPLQYGLGMSSLAHSNLTNDQAKLDNIIRLATIYGGDLSKGVEALHNGLYPTSLPEVSPLVRYNEAKAAVPEFNLKNILPQEALQSLSETKIQQVNAEMQKLTKAYPLLGIFVSLLGALR